MGRFKNKVIAGHLAARIESVEVEFHPFDFLGALLFQVFPLFAIFTIPTYGFKQ